MDAAEEADVPLAEVLGDGLVGREHELLDDLVALVVGCQVGADDLALVPQIDLDLGHDQFQRPAAEPSLAEDHRQFEHPLEQVADLRGDLDAGDSLAVGLHHDGVRILVREATIDPDRRSGEGGVGPDPFRVELEQGAHRVARLALLQAGQRVGEDLRQHRDDPVGQVDARASRAGRAVDRRIDRDEVADVGDMDAQCPEPPLVA